MKTKIKKIDLINKLSFETKALKAQMFHSYYFAYGELTSLSKKNFLASAVIVTVTDLSGKEILRPVGIRTGLSLVTIQALQEDIKRSQKDLLEFNLEKPK
jgi:hypothetical protein